MFKIEPTTAPKQLIDVQMGVSNTIWSFISIIVFVEYDRETLILRAIDLNIYFSKNKTKLLILIIE